MAKAKDRITLNECSKADLIWVINRILQMTAFGDVNRYLERALNDLWYEKQRQRLSEAERINELAAAKRREYVDLLSPYQGEPFNEIPLPVLNKGAKLLEEAQVLDKKWSRLMGI